MNQAGDWSRCRDTSSLEVNRQASNIGHYQHIGRNVSETHGTFAFQLQAIMNNQRRRNAARKTP